MTNATEPITVTIPHRLGRDAAKERIANSLDAVRTEIGAYVSSFEYTWTDYRLSFHASALLHTVNGDLEVFDEFVRIQLWLPGLLHLLGQTIVSRIEQRGQALLEGPSDQAS
jgi:hypothetical protein